MLQPRNGVRVAVVDDHALICSLLVDWLDRHGFEAVGIFAPQQEDLLERLGAATADVILLDDHLGEPAVSVVTRCIELGALVLMLTEGTDRVFHARCIEAGASGIVSKGTQPAELVGAIEAVVAGRSLISPAQRAELIIDLRRARSEDRLRRAPFSGLTEREAQVLAAICEGRSAAEIADRWLVSVATIRSHIRAVLVKLGAGSQLEAAAMARRAGWPWLEDGDGITTSDDDGIITMHNNAASGVGI